MPNLTLKQDKVTMFRSIARAISLILIIGTPNIVQAGGGCPGGYTPQDGVC
jgi:hypothetical protein